MQCLTGNSHMQKGNWAERVPIFADTNLEPGAVGVVGKPVIPWFEESEDWIQGKLRGDYQEKLNRHTGNAQILSAHIFD